MFNCIINLINEQATEDNHPDKRHLLAAVNAMTDVAAAINEFKRRKDLGRTFLPGPLTPWIRCETRLTVYLACLQRKVFVSCVEAELVAAC